jgi:predicted nucleotidyltransferase
MKKLNKTEPKIEIPIEKIRKFCTKNHIRKLALFGSVLTSQFKKKSDIDFLVEFDSKHIPGLMGVSEMEFQLEEIVGRKADLRTPRDLSPYFRQEVIDNSYHLYGKERFN